jgi:hypothetical protein
MITFPTLSKTGKLYFIPTNAQFAHAVLYLGVLHVAMVPVPNAFIEHINNFNWPFRVQ